MPEWPEMEHYRKQLSGLIVGNTIQGTEVTRAKSINVDPAQFEAELVGRAVWFIERRGKMLIFHLDNGKRLLLHLMLGGLIHFGPEDEPVERSVQVSIRFQKGTLRFIGLRLGYLHLLSQKETENQLRDLGPDPLDKRLTLERFKERFKGKRGAIKTALVDQHVLAGIGNCYADEIAFAAEVRPDVKIPELEPNTWERLYASMHEMLQDALAHGGYMEMPITAEDTVTGGYNHHCRVYDRGGEPCVRCGGTIVQAEISSRKMFFCPSCQKDR
ncbi:formamidopyrimidine-DNA glycosylase [Paenibacillus phyllosphaerae]|uniref:Formamidopyrimidine-DNA glycosylase n=1 Tax=Paenibacillus phyllosphaerae TaxID=274593 RepID=A0A7W5FMP3_9BACL|nr:Fpg/Nei family DNA glycosylase [Paenibacillus phyllosphaerae]MBB3110353.1 formamidopyrimidine-DNA glycosylase [Paenibacillus phyllosphaerae]